jgi:hypothetical protein
MNIFVCNDEEAKMAWLHNHDYFCRARVYRSMSGFTLGNMASETSLSAHSEVKKSADEWSYKE